MSSILSSLKFISAKRQTSTDPIQFRREKLSKMLDEQISLATAYMNNTTYQATRMKRVRDENGNKQVVEVQKRVKTWWFTNDNKVAYAVASSLLRESFKLGDFASSKMLCKMSLLE